MRSNRQQSRGNRLSWLLSAAIIICIAALLLFPDRNGTDRSDVSRYSSVEAIRELTTLKGYYHNVAVYEEDREGIEKAVSVIMTWPFNGLIRPGYKRFWLEYDGTTEFGVDANRIDIGKPDSRGVIKIYVPEARVINVDADPASMAMPISDTGLFETISADDISKAFSASQSSMREEAAKDQGLLKRARENVMNLLEKYIVNLGEGLGETYTVAWVDHPIHQ